MVSLDPRREDWSSAKRLGHGRCLLNLFIHYPSSPPTFYANKRIIIYKWHRIRTRYNLKNHLTQILPLQDRETKTKLAKWPSQGHISRTQPPKSNRNTFYSALISENETQYLQSMMWLSMLNIKRYKSPNYFPYKALENGIWRSLEVDH